MSEPLNAGWDDDPAGYDDRRRCWLNDRRVSFIVDAIGPQPRSVLEIGSGTGWLLRRLADDLPATRFTGLEPLPGYVEFAGRDDGGGRIRYVVGTAEDAGELLPDGGFDLVLSNDVLHHVADVGAACAAVAAVTEPGARWLALEPNPANPYVRVRHQLTAGEFVFDAPGFTAAAARAGWTVRRSGRLFLIPPQVREPGPALIRLERRLEHRSRLAGGLALELERRRS